MSNLAQLLIIPKVDYSKLHPTVRAEPVEARLPFDKLRANGIGLSPIMKSLITERAQ